VNVLDVVLLLLLALAAVSGFHRGLALQAFAFGGLLVGLAIGALIAPPLARLAHGAGAQAGIAAITLLVLAAAGDTGGWLLGTRVRERARSTRFGSADAVGGSLVALLASLLAIWFVALNLVNGPFPSVSKEIQESAVVRTLDGALPEPPSLLAEVQRFFDRFGFPDVFAGIPPVPASPVEPPTSEQERAAFDAGARSTVKIYGRACGHVQEGSGFVAADRYVVTNAHVVAGVDAPVVETPDGRTQDATTVLFDPGLDLAILFVPGSTERILDLAPTAAERGDAGTVLGYPGGGPLSASGAAVLRPMEAVGRDIYGSGQAVRDVLELQVIVRPGNSGGPFVLPDGTVAGVVFAASSTQDGVGYAIAADEVRPRLEDADGATTPVGTGPCVR
jgi:S1-C subfamily serine protease